MREFCAPGFGASRNLNMKTLASLGIRRWLRRVLFGLTIVVAFWLLSSYAVAYRFTRRLHPMRPEPTPGIAWGTIDSFRLSTSDGEELGAWYVDGRPHEPVVLLLHGHG